MEQVPHTFMHTHPELEKAKGLDKDHVIIDKQDWKDFMSKKSVDTFIYRINTYVLTDLNNEVVIYPNEDGWKKVKEITKTYYGFSDDEADDFLFRRTMLGAFKEVAWKIIHIYHSIINPDTDYLMYNAFHIKGDESPERVKLIDKAVLWH